MRHHHHYDDPRPISFFSLNFTVEFYALRGGFAHFRDFFFYMEDIDTSVDSFKESKYEHFGKAAEKTSMEMCVCVTHNFLNFPKYSECFSMICIFLRRYTKCFVQLPVCEAYNSGLMLSTFEIYFFEYIFWRIYNSLIFI